MLEIKAIVVELSEKDAREHSERRGRPVLRFTAMYCTPWIDKMLVGRGDSQEAALRVLHDMVVIAMSFVKSVTEHTLTFPEKPAPLQASIEDVEDMTAALERGTRL